MPDCLAPAAGGHDCPSGSVHPTAKYSISAGSLFKGTFQQQPCRISAADPAAGFPGCLCPFLVRKDVLDMESSRGHMRQCSRLAGCCKTGGIAADCCFLLIKSSFCLAAGFCVLSFPSKNWLGAEPLGDRSPLLRCGCGWPACCGVKRN